MHGELNTFLQLIPATVNIVNKGCQVLFVLTWGGGRGAS